MVIFGGSSGDNCITPNDIGNTAFAPQGSSTLFVYNVTARLWLSQALYPNVGPPSPRYLQSAGVVGKCMYVYGGLNCLTAPFTTGCLVLGNDFWAYDLVTTTWHVISTSTPLGVR